MTALGVLFATLIGLSLGLMGGGGSILTVPAFVYGLGFTAKTAIAMSLPVVGATSLAGALGHWRAGNVHLRAAVTFGIVAMAGSYFGARLAGFLTGAVQLALLSVVMLVASGFMLRARALVRPVEPAERAREEIAVARLVPVALAVGVLTGIVGIGGGFLIVPSLVLLGHVPMKQAVGTSLLVIAMNSASGFAGHAGTVVVPWPFVASFTTIAIAGILAGTYLVRFVPADRLKHAFAVFLFTIAILMLYQNRGAFMSAGVKSTTVPGETRRAERTDGSLQHAQSTRRPRRTGVDR